MSKENLDQFIQKVADDEQLQARIGEEIDIDSLIALGAEHGCEFTAEDLAADGELSDEEFDGVAGGLAPSQPQDINAMVRLWRITQSGCTDPADAHEMPPLSPGRAVGRAVTR